MCEAEICKCLVYLQIVDLFSVRQLVDILTKYFSSAVVEIPVKSRYFIKLSGKNP